MGFSYVITMAIIVTASLAIALFVLFSGVFPYVRYSLSVACNFVVEYYYISTKYVSLVIKNTGASRIVYISINITQIDNSSNFLSIRLRYYIPPGESVTFVCMRDNLTYWLCKFYIPLSNTLRYGANCNKTSIFCTVTNTENFVIIPGHPFRISVFARFSNENIRVRVFNVVPIS